MTNTFCESCGASIDDGAKFCPACGRPAAQPAQATPVIQATPVYQTNVYATQQNDLTKPMTVGGYMLMFLIMIIPFVGFIMPFVWAFSSGTNINKRNLARAILLWALIIFGIYLILLLAFGSIFLTLFKNSAY